MEDTHHSTSDSSPWRAPRGAGRRRAHRIAGLVAIMLFAAAGLATFSPGAGAVSDTTAVTLPGNPLTVYVGPRGQCQSSYTINGSVAGNFFPGGGGFYEFSPVADCGFFLAFPSAGSGQPPALEGQTFGFDGHAGPHGLTSYTPLHQTETTGAGTSVSPYTQTTTFEVIDSLKAKDALVTETTTYVNGSPQFTSTYNVKNTALSKIYFRAMYAGDLFVAGNDLGSGLFLAGPPRFIGGQNPGSGILGGFQEAPLSSPPWSSFQELDYPSVWTAVQNSVNSEKAFDNTIEPMEVDNAAGVEWDQLRTLGLEKGAEQAFTIINRTQAPSGLKFSPVNQTLTQGQTETITAAAQDTAGQPYAGKSLRYKVTGANPQSGAVTLNGSGQAQISYVGNNAGIDTIQMYVDLGGSGVQTPSDPAGTATVTFVPKPPTPNSSYKIQSVKANSDGTITITFVPAQSGQATLEVTVPTASISRREAIAARRHQAKRCKKGQVKIKGKCRPQNTLSGRVSANGLAGVPLTLTVKPSSKVAGLLKKGRTVHLTATLTYRSSLGGTPTVRVFHFTVKGKKKGHGHHRH